MPYIVEQTSGSKADLAAEMFAARKAGEFDRMLSLYRKATGDLSPADGKYGNIPTVTNSSWWAYNASSAMRKPSPACDRKVKMNYDGSAKWHNILAGVAKQHHGGTWEVYWEY